MFGGTEMKPYGVTKRVQKRRSLKLVVPLLSYFLSVPVYAARFESEYKNRIPDSAMKVIFDCIQI